VGAPGATRAAGQVHVVTVRPGDPGFAGVRDRALAVRREVFIVGQGIDADLEVDGRDDAAVHVVASLSRGSDAADALPGARPDATRAAAPAEGAAAELPDHLDVGAGRLVVEPPGFAGLDPALGPVAHLGRISVREPWRGSGIGATVVAALQRAADDAGHAVAYLGSQSHAVGFYERLGWTVFGAEFLDADLPHRHMVRRRADTPTPPGAGRAPTGTAPDPS
jgi:predicted GNAT family N-acyltransferase